MVDILTGQACGLAGEDAFMGAKRKSYSPVYRSAVAAEIGVRNQALGRWVAQERARMDAPPPALDSDERAELERLRTENSELRMDREFLKKAAAFFAAENSDPSRRSS